MGAGSSATLSRFNKGTSDSPAISYYTLRNALLTDSKGGLSLREQVKNNLHQYDVRIVADKNDKFHLAFYRKNSGEHIADSSSVKTSEAALKQVLGGSKAELPITITPQASDSFKPAATASHNPNSSLVSGHKTITLTGLCQPSDSQATAIPDQQITVKIGCFDPRGTTKVVGQSNLTVNFEQQALAKCFNSSFEYPITFPDYQLGPSKLKLHLNGEELRMSAYNEANNASLSKINGEAIGYINRPEPNDSRTFRIHIGTKIPALHNKCKPEAHQHHNAIEEILHWFGDSCCKPIIPTTGNGLKIKIGPITFLGQEVLIK